MILDVKEIHTYYGTSHILFGISFEVRGGRGRLPPGKKWRRKDHDPQEHHRTEPA